MIAEKERERLLCPLQTNVYFFFVRPSSVIIIIICVPEPLSSLSRSRMLSICAFYDSAYAEKNLFYNLRMATSAPSFTALRNTGIIPDAISGPRFQTFSSFCNNFTSLVTSLWEIRVLNDELAQFKRIRARTVSLLCVKYPARWNNMAIPLFNPVLKNTRPFSSWPETQNSIYSTFDNRGNLEMILCDAVIPISIAQKENSVKLWRVIWSDTIVRRLLDGNSDGGERDMDCGTHQ